MKAPILLLLLCLQPLGAKEISDKISDYFCNSKILQKYGLEGLSMSVNYSEIFETMQNNYCPQIERSCCSRDDFEKANRMWQEKIVNIRKYVTKIFKIYRNMSMLQPALLQVYESLSDKKKQEPYCKNIDATFFNSPMNYDEVYQYLESGLQAFVYMQKGFYCMICDSGMHQYLDDKRYFSRHTITISDDMCNDLVYFFKEFIYNKVMFFDPFVQTLQHLYNCLYTEPVNFFETEYEANYQSIRNCLTKNIECEFLCKEFRLGTSSSMFIGTTSQYSVFYKHLIELIGQHGKQLIHIDFPVEEENYEEDFFGLNKPLFKELYADLKDYNFMSYSVEVMPKGLNVFSSAKNSKFFVSDQLSTFEMRSNFGINSGIGLDRQNPIDKIPDTNEIKPGSDFFNQFHTNKNQEAITAKEQDIIKLEAMKKNNELPTTKELVQFQLKIDLYDKNTIADLKQGNKLEIPSEVTSSNFAYFKPLKSFDGSTRVLGFIVVALLASLFVF